MVVAERPDNTTIAAPKHLRYAVLGPELEFVKSFPITRKLATRVETISVCVYRLLVPIEPVDDVDMPHFSLGEGVRLRIKPIER